MEKKVIINIHTTQIDNISKNEDEIELMTEGMLCIDSNIIKLEYDETKLSGMEESKTTVIIEDNKISMSRLGISSTVMDFEKGKTNKTLYNTEFGSFFMEIFTRNVDIIMKNTPLLIDITIDYDIIVKNMFERTNTMRIIVR